MQAVVNVLHSSWLTTGPTVDRFETAFAETVGAKYAVAVSSGTAALHSACAAAGFGPGDEGIVPPMTFAATANTLVHLGATPRFADVRSDTLLLDPDKVEELITEKTRAITAVDYAGQPANYNALRALADKHNLLLIADACHAPGATRGGKKVGALADMTCFSFHPVKHITTGEGGMIVTDDPDLAAAMRRFRNHGIDTDARARSNAGTWYYEMVDLGLNYRLTDIQAALGLSQLENLPAWLKRRREIAARYDQAFADLPGISPLGLDAAVEHAYHLYVVRVNAQQAGVTRDELYARLRERGIGVNVHYIPVHLHPWYRTHLQTGPGLCPAAEEAYEEILSLPMFPALTDADIDTVIQEVRDAVG